VATDTSTDFTLDSAALLAEDVKSHLRGEPVSAARLVLWPSVQKPLRRMGTPAAVAAFFGELVGVSA
jgi:hypothetical protein